MKPGEFYGFTKNLEKSADSIARRVFGSPKPIFTRLSRIGGKRKFTEMTPKKTQGFV